MQIVEMEMQDVEFIGLLQNAIEHQKVVRHGIADAGVEPVAAVCPLRGRADVMRVAAGKERDVVAHLNQFFGEIGHNALSAAV